MVKKDGELSGSWLKSIRLRKKKKYDFSLVIQCSGLLFISVFIALVPIVIQYLIESSDNILESVGGTFLEALVEIVCKNDFRYISISVLFILFVEQCLLNDKSNTKFFDIFSLIWLFLVLIIWLLMISNENVTNYFNAKYENGVFIISIGCFAGTMVVCFMNIISKCTKIKYVYESVRKK